MSCLTRPHQMAFDFWLNTSSSSEGHSLQKPELNNLGQQCHMNDLAWTLKKISGLPGLLLLESSIWILEDALFTLFCDACPTGMGFWIPKLNIGFFLETPPNLCSSLIFYFEALCVLNSLLEACCWLPCGGCFVIYTDNSNTVDIFNSFKAAPEYNILLQAAVDLLYAGD